MGWKKLSKNDWFMFNEYRKAHINLSIIKNSNEINYKVRATCIENLPFGNQKTIFDKKTIVETKSIGLKLVGAYKKQIKFRCFGKNYYTKK